MTTTTDLSAERAILNWAADRIDAGPHDPVLDTDPLQEAYDDARRHYAGELRRWADELDAAPATWQLPPEPGPEVRLRGRSGLRWRRYPAGWSNGVRHAIEWSYLLATDSPLSAVPPEPEVPDA
jgi:hypothetical protein